MKIKKRSLIFILLLLLVVGVGTTYAVYFNAVSIPNQFDVMTYNVKLEDDFSNKWGERNVKITNVDESNTPVILRISFNEMWSKNVGKSKSIISNVVNGVNVVDKNWTDDFLNNFYLADDGWYYYSRVLNPNESVQILKSVKLNEELIKDSNIYSKYKNYDYDLSFNYEALSADSDESLIRSAWDRSLKIEGGVVSEIN